MYSGFRVAGSMISVDFDVGLLLLLTLNSK
jgi:hypothetical protein